MPPLAVPPTDTAAQPFALQATIDPISQGAGTVTTPWINAAQFAAVVAILQTGVMGASGTIDAKLQCASDGSGTGAADVPNKAIAQIVKATGDNKQAVIVARNGYEYPGAKPYLRLSVTVGVAASLISAGLYGVGNVWANQVPINYAAGVAQLV
jgi:hypothetical protein